MDLGKMCQCCPSGQVADSGRHWRQASRQKPICKRLHLAPYLHSPVVHATAAEDGGAVLPIE